MKIKNIVRIFVAILFLIFPMDILGEKVPKYTMQNYAKRELEEDNNYIIVQYGDRTVYSGNKFKNKYRQSISHVDRQTDTIDMSQAFVILKTYIEKIYFSQPATSMQSFLIHLLMQTLYI